MTTSIRHKLIAAFATALVLTAALAAAGCNNAQPATQPDEKQESAQVEASATQEPAQNEPAQTKAATYDDWIAQHPQQYESYAVDKIDENGKNHSHFYLRPLVENYDGKLKLNSSCIACKSTSYNDLYNEYGEEALALEWDDVKDKVEAYYDCTLCHTDSVSLELEPSLTYFANLAGDAFANNDERTLVCGQCHNGLAFYRTPVGSDDFTFDDFDPFRYGTDGEAVYQALLEDKCGTSPEEATGATVIRGTGENDLEIFQGSIHQSMGLTCADCHMRPVDDQSGEPFTDHNASGSPLENESALELCLTCHEKQGVSDTEAMVTFARERQQSFADRQATVQGKIETIKQLLTDATANGEIDEAVLEQARSNYSQANFFVQFYSCNLKNGAKAVHNYATSMQYLDRAEKLLDDGIASLSA